MDKRPIELLDLPLGHERALRNSFIRTIGVLKQRQNNLFSIPGIGHCGVFLISHSLDMQSRKDRTTALTKAIYHA